jgi:hypothetical protein
MLGMAAMSQGKSYYGRVEQGVTELHTLCHPKLQADSEAAQFGWLLFTFCACFVVCD